MKKSTRNFFSSLLSVKPALALALILPLFFTSCDDQSSLIGPDQKSGVVESQISSKASSQQPQNYIVVFHRNQVPGNQVGRAVSELARAHGIQPDFLYQHSISGFAATLPDVRVQALMADRRVKSVTPDVEISLFPGPAHHRPDHCGGPGNSCNDPDNGDDGEESNQVIPWGIERVGGPLEKSSNRAWIIDTGIDLNHMDLNVNTNLGKNCVPRGRNTFNDEQGHGTHVAGTIAAIDNNVDVVGVSESTEVVPVRVLDNSGSGQLSWIICGVDHVAGNFSKGDVANMSLGGRTTNTSLDDAVIAAADLGVLFSIASGNSGADARDFTPARTGGMHDNIYTIAAIDQNDQFTSWSNFGEPVSFVGPGVAILSTKRGGGTEEKTGTSMSAPHIAGLLLLDRLCFDGTVKGSDGADYKIAYQCGDEVL